jgi:mRNA-degrading endonuclease RelE of RelBE toxin-antitoxin system
MRTLVELPTFKKQAEAVWSEAEYEAFTFWLAQNPEAGDVVPGTGGGRKVRWKRAGSGKSGGSRVIYYHLVASEKILLVAVYGKSARENLPAHEITKLLE